MHTLPVGAAFSPRFVFSIALGPVAPKRCVCMPDYFVPCNDSNFELILQVKKNPRGSVGKCSLGGVSNIIVKPNRRESVRWLYQASTGENFNPG